MTRPELIVYATEQAAKTQAEVEALRRELATTERELEMSQAENLGPGDYGEYAYSTSCATGRHEEAEERPCLGCGCGCHISVDERMDEIEIRHHLEVQS